MVALLVIERIEHRKKLFETKTDYRNKISITCRNNMTKERKAAISASKKGKPLSKNHVLKIKESNANRSEEAKRQTSLRKSEALKGRFLSKEELENRLIAAQKQDRRDKISEALKGRKHSPEFIEKRRLAIIAAINKKRSTIVT